MWLNRVLVNCFNYWCTLAATQFLQLVDALSLMPKQRKVFSRDARDYKMVLAVRADLKMGKGKIAAQCAHAAVAAYRETQKSEETRSWIASGQTKIAVKVKDLAEINRLHKLAKRNNIPVSLIHDAGRTQVDPNTLTVMALGPASADVLNSVSGGLSLL